VVPDLDYESTQMEHDWITEATGTVRHGGVAEHVVQNVGEERDFDRRIYTAVDRAQRVLFVIKT
jgi:hypothetical protein